MTRLLHFTVGSACAAVFLAIGYEVDWPSFILGVVAMLLADLFRSIVE